MVEPAYASSPYGRVPKGPLLNSRACLRILSLGVEYLKVLISRACLRTLKVMAALTVEPAYASLLVERAYAP